ncbi:MgtC/SapB family protein [Rhodococcus sp. NPDC059968]|uniref:MgtC/SapB family protein n=1 Tax=Rhodococcus sp. NPDC059968 TaxID=3347017 RepID=UPI00366ACAAA
MSGVGCPAAHGSVLDGGRGVGRASPAPAESDLSGQIVTGIGFLHGGILSRAPWSARCIVTAASIWVVATVGMAAGAGLHALAVAGTGDELTITWRTRR